MNLTRKESDKVFALFPDCKWYVHCRKVRTIETSTKKKIKSPKMPINTLVYVLLVFFSMHGMHTHEFLINWAIHQNEYGVFQSSCKGKLYTNSSNAPILNAPEPEAHSWKLSKECVESSQNIIQTRVWGIMRTRKQDFTMKKMITFLMWFITALKIIPKQDYQKCFARWPQACSPPGWLIWRDFPPFICLWTIWGMIS